MCPICVVAVGAGLGLSRWLGVDDTVSGLWIGALLLSLTLWTHDWIVKKGRGFKFSLYVIGLVYYGLTLVPLYFVDIIGHPLNKIWGIDKFIFGAVLGSVVFWSGTLLHNYLKNKNSGKSYFNYQKVIIPVVILLIISALLFYAI